MALYIGGTRINAFSIGPDTSPGDLVPERMDYGLKGYSKGKEVIGTGKAFATAVYGRGKLQMILDENGNKRYGISIFTRIVPNLVFITPAETGDFFRQSQYFIEPESGSAIEIGENATGKMYAIQDGNRFKVYLENIEDTNTKINYFYGKDNDL